ncbi:General stress protein 69 [Luteitalea pratensis]|uniref:General stress protein 69 n=1 Tax=Luteitalea pratensis TaxID=1855912 RepID=A0A143PR60_LUTPR|nr:aldo/keto reductase [Luteitalea pratensis]AMY10289.1 General stress protein 69 [Luteitalea pratensis]
MQLREFGSTGVSVSPVAFGAMRITADSGGTSSALLHALERGVSMIDTARNYGESEAIVGQTLREWRGPRPLVATKVKPKDVSNWRFYVPMSEQFTRASIVDSVETSLRTLGLECIDLLQIHQWYYRWSHETEWLEALDALRASGKVRFIGVSAQDHEHDGVLRLVDDRVVDAVQVVLNAFESRPFVSVVPLAEARGVGVIARCVFDHSAALAGVATRESLAHDVKLSNASPEIVTEYLRRIDRLRDEATAHAMTLVQLSVRFALSRPGVSTIAVSSATPGQVDDVVAAAERGPLPWALFDRICREHVWVKNFYYFSKATVDGQPMRP